MYICAVAKYRLLLIGCNIYYTCKIRKNRCDHEMIIINIPRYIYNVHKYRCRLFCPEYKMILKYYIILISFI